MSTSVSSFFARNRRRSFGSAVVAGVAAIMLATAGGSSATAATTIDGPVGLGTAAAFGVLGASTVTNTGLSAIGGDVGLSPGSAITGFPPGTLTGAFHTDTVSAQAQQDTTTAYNVAASLSPTSSGLGDLVGLTLTPGVYSGNTLSLSGNLTLSGSASSVWVFQAASTLITSSASTITMTGGASSCNVFWQVGSSATLGTSSSMVGTVMALDSISSNTGTTVQGRLLARTGAVTLDDTNVVLPSNCTPAGTVLTSPTITSGTPTSATAGSPYSFAVSSGGTGTAPTSYAVTSGALPSGLNLNSATGLISGTPRTAGRYAMTIAVTNGIAPPATASYQLQVSAASVRRIATGSLAETGTDSTWVAPWALEALLIGTMLLAIDARARALRRSR